MVNEMQLLFYLLVTVAFSKLWFQLISSVSNFESMRFEIEADKAWAEIKAIISKRQWNEMEEIPNHGFLVYKLIQHADVIVSYQKVRELFVNTFTALRSIAGNTCPKNPLLRNSGVFIEDTTFLLRIQLMK